MCYLWHSPSSPVSLVFTVSSSGAPSLEDRSASSPLVCRMMTCSSAIRLIQSGSPSILTPPRFCLSSENSYKITTTICCLWTVGCLSSKQIMTVGFFSIRKDIKSTLSSNRDDVWDQFRVCLYTEIGFNFFWSNNVTVDNNNVTIHQQHEQQGQHCGFIWGDFVAVFVIWGDFVRHLLQGTVRIFVFFSIQQHGVTWKREDKASYNVKRR